MTYATDGKCDNVEPGTFNHECGRPATWVGTHPNGFKSGYCDDCRAFGYEARNVGGNQMSVVDNIVNRLHVAVLALRHIDGYGNVPYPRQNGARNDGNLTEAMESADRHHWPIPGAGRRGFRPVGAHRATMGERRRRGPARR